MYGSPSPVNGCKIASSVPSKSSGGTPKREHSEALTAEVALRLLGRAIAQAGDEGPIRLGKLESLYEALASAKAAANGPGFRLRRTLGGALVTLAAGRLTVERAPPSGGPKRR